MCTIQAGHKIHTGRKQKKKTFEKGSPNVCETISAFEIIASIKRSSKSVIKFAHLKMHMAGTCHHKLG